MIKLSVLDLAYIGEGFSPTDALTNALDLAQYAEAAGFTRFWLAEHHNLAGIEQLRRRRRPLPLLCASLKYTGLPPLSARARTGGPIRGTLSRARRRPGPFLSPHARAPDRGTDTPLRDISMAYLHGIVLSR